MDNEEPKPSTEQLLSKAAHAYQAIVRETDELWRNEPHWKAEHERLVVLETAIAERQTRKHLPLLPSAGESAEKQRGEQGHVTEKHRCQTSHTDDHTLPAALDALEGWNARKTPRLKGSDSSTKNSRAGPRLVEDHLPEPRRLDSIPEPSRQQHFVAPRPRASANAGVQEPMLPLKPEPGTDVARLVAQTEHKKRDLSSIRAQKKPRDNASSSASPQSSIPLSTERQPPEWYIRLKPSTKRSATTSNADTLLQRIKDQTATLRTLGPDGNNQKEMNELRKMLHEAPFLTMGQAGPQLLRNKRMLHNEDGLPRIFDDQFAGPMKGCWPWDVRSDAAELYHRWCAKNFDDDMLFGLILAQKSKYAENDRSADQVDKKFQVSSKYKGNGKLVNGQWWPTLLCALRDGAHGDSQAGISGDAAIGAYSCFMSGGNNHVYPDRDHGNVVEYFGQDTNTPGQISRGTQLLMKNKKENIPVRFIRSSKALNHSIYAPSLGFRYDGLYDVTGYELVDSIKERYRFKLVRQAGQGPIRGGTRPEARPTQQEVERYKQDKRFRGVGKT